MQDWNKSSFYCIILHLTVAKVILSLIEDCYNNFKSSCDSQLVVSKTIVTKW